MVNTKFKFKNSIVPGVKTKSLANSKIALNNENSLNSFKNRQNFFKNRQNHPKSSKSLIIPIKHELKLKTKLKRKKNPRIYPKNITKSWLTGFIDGDGSFFLEKSINKSPGSRPTYRPTLSITQNDPQLLNKIKNYFGCGSVTQKSKKAWHYRCRTFKDFKKFIIPRLEGAPFQTEKRDQLNLLIEAISFLDSTKNFDENELEKIIEKIRNLNDNTNYISQNTIDRNWFLGFFEAEGNFYFNVYQNKSSKNNEIRIAFKVTQKNKNLMQKIQKFWGFGNVQSERSTRNIWKYNVEGMENVIKFGMKVFETIPLKGKKNIERVKFLKIIRILRKNQDIFVSNYPIRVILKLKKLDKEIKKLREL